MSKNQQTVTYVHTTSYIVRGILYALTSISALFAGYIIQARFFSLAQLFIDLFVLAVPIIASIFFFMCYAERFPTPTKQDSEMNDIEVVLRREAIYSYLILATSLICNAILSACLIATLWNYSIPVWPILFFLIYAGTYFYYGLFLWRHPDPSIPTIRHQLVWSVILSIGVSLYFGLSYESLATSSLPLVPVYVIAAVYTLTRILRLKKLSFLVTTLVIFLAVTILSFFIKKEVFPYIPLELGEYFFIVQFCVIMSSYLAVFEAWKITADIAKSTEVNQEGDSTNTPSKMDRYSIATLTALMVSVWALPFFFIFSQYGTVFLIAFGIHSILSFLVWSYWGKEPDLRTRNWGFHKIWVGVTFLTVLVITSFPAFNKQPDSRTLEGFVSWSGLSLVATLLTLPLTGILLHDVFHRDSMWDVFKRRINFTRALSFLSLISCIILLIVIQPNYKEDSIVYFKSDLAFIFYTICILLCSIVEFCYHFNKQAPNQNSNQSIVKQIFAFFVLTRAITSLIITFGVLIPGLHSGINFWECLKLALPFLLSAMGGFSLNDYFDAKKDLINKPYRAIPSGRLSRNFVLLFSIISIVLALVSAHLFSQNNFQFILYILCILGVTSYNFFVKYISLTKTFLTAIVSTLPILFSVVVFDYPIIFFFLPIATSLFILGREWLMDTRDMEGDASEQIRTVPMIIGADVTSKFGFGFQLIALLLLIPIVIHSKSYPSILLFIILFISLATLIPLWFYRSGSFQRRAIQFLWLPMFLGILLFIV